MVTHAGRLTTGLGKIPLLSRKPHRHSVHRQNGWRSQPRRRVGATSNLEGFRVLAPLHGPQESNTRRAPSEPCDPRHTLSTSGTFELLDHYIGSETILDHCIGSPIYTLASEIGPHV